MLLVLRGNRVCSKRVPLDIHIVRKQIVNCILDDFVYVNAGKQWFNIQPYLNKIMIKINKLFRKGKWIFNSV